MLSGLLKQLKHDGRILEGCIGSMGAVEEVAEEAWDWPEDVVEFWDNVSGKALDTNLVKQARQDELVNGIRKFNVYRSMLAF